MALLDSVLIDTSTLLSLDRFPDALASEDPGEATRWGAIETLVLFEKLRFDQGSIVVNASRLGWLEGFEGEGWNGLQPNLYWPTGAAQLGRRASEMSEAIDWSASLVERLLDSRVVTPLAEIVHDLSWEPDLDFEPYGPSATSNGVYSAFFLAIQEGQIPVAFWRILDALWEFGDAENSFRRLAQIFVHLTRLFYYLALHEQVGGVLLIHPAKNFDLIDIPDLAEEYRAGGQLLDAFDARVRAAYLERRRQWLDLGLSSLAAPPVTRLVLSEAERRGWNIGRTVGWLRQQPETVDFRQGLRQLDILLDRGDHIGIDAVLAELEAASQKWATRLGSDIRPR